MISNLKLLTYVLYCQYTYKVYNLILFPLFPALRFIKHAHTYIIAFITPPECEKGKKRDELNMIYDLNEIGLTKSHAVNRKRVRENGIWIIWNQTERWKKAFRKKRENKHKLFWHFEVWIKANKFSNEFSNLFIYIFIVVWHILKAKCRMGAKILKKCETKMIEKNDSIKWHMDAHKSVKFISIGSLFCCFALKSRGRIKLTPWKANEKAFHRKTNNSANIQSMLYQCKHVKYPLFCANR